MVLPAVELGYRWHWPCVTVAIGTLRLRGSRRASVTPGEGEVLGSVPVVHRAMHVGICVVAFFIFCLFCDN